jgi:hypothetical protein
VSYVHAADCPERVETLALHEIDVGRHYTLSTLYVPPLGGDILRGFRVIALALPMAAPGIVNRPTSPYALPVGRSTRCSPPWMRRIPGYERAGDLLPGW